MPKKEIPETRLIELFPKFSPLRVKYKDIFDMDAFYEALHEWLLEYGWKDETNEGKQDFDHWETYYSEKIGRDGAKNILIRWRPVKDPPDAPFLRYYLDFNFIVIALVPVEVIKEGHKIKVHKAEMELMIKAYIEEKYKEEFSASKVLKSFKGIFSKRVYRKILEQRKKELYQETYVLQNFIKKWFKMKRYQPYDESKVFFKSQAWPSHKKEE